MKTRAIVGPNCPYTELIGGIVEVVKFLDSEEIVVKVWAMGEVKMKTGWYQIII